MPIHSNGLRILSLDGGWVRGLSTLFILQELLDRIRVRSKLDTSPLPCDIFDLIVGTSSGGIIALMLGRLKMSVDEAIDIYQKLCQDVFTEPFGILHPLLSKPQYSAETLENAIKKFSKDIPLIDPESMACKVAVVAINELAANDVPELLRTYESSSGGIGCTISDAARATTAAFGFFKPAMVKIKHGLEVTYLDGSLGHNNPTDLAVQEARDIWGMDTKLKCVVSIGNGMGPNVFYKGTKLNFEEIQNSSRKVHFEMETRYGGRQGIYFRFDVETDLAEVGLDEWKRSKEVGQLTHAYIRRESVRFSECVDAVTSEYLKRTEVGDKPKVAHQLSDCKDVEFHKVETMRSSHAHADDKLRRWLAPPDPSINHNAACEKHTSGTGEWLLNGNEYKEWKEQADSFLWINSLPGGGKTIMCSTIIEDLKIACDNNRSVAVGYFYFDFSDPSKLVFRNVLHSLVIQLCFQCSNVPSSLDALYSRNQDGAHQPSLKDLSATLEDMIKPFNHVYIVLDGLDECDSGGQTTILQFVERIISRKFGRLHVLITSRRLPQIEKTLNPWANGQISLEVAINEDIQSYIRDTLRNDPNLKDFEETEKEMVSRELTGRSNGMFKWVECQLMELGQCYNSAALMEALEELPESLDETYIRILRRIPKRVSKLACKILQFLAFGARHMSIEELAEVVAVDPESEEIIVPSRRLRNPGEVLNICPSLLTVSEEAVRLSHFSVKEYLVSDRIKMAGPLDIHCYSINAITANKFIGQACLTYLLMFDKIDSLGDNLLKDFPLSQYAAQYWVYHTRFDYSITRMLQELVKKLLRPCIPFYNWVRLHDMDRKRVKQPWDVSVGPPLYYSSLVGLYEQSKWLVENGADVNEEGGGYGRALVAASSGGHEAIVQLLLEHGADTNAGGGIDGNALGQASYKGDYVVARLLLEHGADVNAPGGMFGSALAVASYNGHDIVARLLLEHGADVNADRGLGSALLVASVSGHDVIARLLLEHGADVNAQGFLYGSPLEEASARGHEAVARILLEHGADMVAPGGEYGSALVAASYGGHEAVVRILLEHGADVVAPEGEYGSALVAASYGGNEAVMRLLLEHRADANVQEEEYGKALAVASSFGRDAIAGLLLEHGVDGSFNAPGGKYASALEAASWGGHMALLLRATVRGAFADIVRSVLGGHLSADHCYDVDPVLDPAELSEECYDLYPEQSHQTE